MLHIREGQGRKDRCCWKDRGETGEVQLGCSVCAPGSSFIAEDVHGGELGKESIKDG